MAARYGVIFVSARELLHAASLKPDRTGKMAKQFIDKGSAEEAPENIVGPLVLQRLMTEEVRMRGFVLAGFPSTESHVQYLTAHSVWVRDAVLLDLADDLATRREIGRAHV